MNRITWPPDSMPRNLSSQLWFGVGVGAVIIIFLKKLHINPGVPVFLKQRGKKGGYKTEKSGFEKLKTIRGPHGSPCFLLEGKLCPLCSSVVLLGYSTSLCAHCTAR